MTGNINTDFFHDLNSVGIDKGRFRPCGKRRNPVTPKMIGNALRHLRAAGIGCAYEKDSFSHRTAFFIYIFTITKYNPASIKIIPVTILAHFSKTVRALNTLPIVFAEKARIKANTRTGIAVPMP